MMFNSRGFKDAAAMKGAEMEESLLEASQGGKLPIVVDTSPCLAQIKGSLANSALRCGLHGLILRHRSFLLQDPQQLRGLPQDL